ncbi:hypothetical protein NLM24_43645 [Nocardia zapadnayensis]|nr:hypothetical protein [Nocardia zapadnayensis]MCX0277373.1 hypothetical protein [Nocardia zapadnayensis]
MTGIIALFAVAGAVSCYYFALGRCVGPVRERLPFDELGRDGVLHTLRRGWSSAAPGARAVDPEGGRTHGA